jgi:hypothetical protein
MSIGISRWIFKMESPESLCVVMEDRNAVFDRFSPLNDRSAEQLVTGKVQRIVINTLMFGYIDVACLRVMVGVTGKLLNPYSVKHCCHFTFQQSSSLRKHRGEGRSSAYKSASCLAFAVNSSKDIVTITDGTRDNPSKAVLWWGVKRDFISLRRWSSTGIEMERQ